MRITAVESTDLFVGSTHAPRQVVRVTVLGEPGDLQAEVRIRVEGPTVTTPQPVPAVLSPGVERLVEVGVLVAAPQREGSIHRVTAVADSGSGAVTAGASIEAAATGWTMWMVSHFHYDPVWWNTQGGFTQAWYDLPVAEQRRPAFARTAFDLTRAHLDAARQDADYKFVLAELDYLKPYWDACPGDRADLRRLLAEERVELVGGTYNEPNTNLTDPESTIRNALYGIGYQRDVLGGDPRSAWMLDVFGHDPAFPGLMADAGLDSSAWARGPFHMVGPKRHTGDITRMQFPSEFEWISPSGRGLLTSYMANHYVAGWDVERRETLDEAMAEAYAQFSDLKRVAASRNVLLPVGHDHNVPSRWCTEIHREWPKRYVWPRFAVGLPREFFAAVRAEVTGLSLAGAPEDARGKSFSPQTRDMNPVYTGKDVSYIDTKQAQRAAEVAVLDGERLATLAALLGARFPSEALDKAWRQLAYGAHHDAVTGTESDQVYLDLVGGWREAYELGESVREAAVVQIAASADTRGAGRAVLAVNPLSWTRSDIARIGVSYPQPGPSGAALFDEVGDPVPAVTETVSWHPDGTLAELTLSFLARDMPPLGYRVYRVVDAPAVPEGWVRLPGERAAQNAALRIEADPAQGGALSRIADRRTGRELLRPAGLGAELVLQEEHPDHPVWNEGPWHLLPKGPGRGSGGVSAEVSVQASPAGQRIVSTFELDGLRVTQEALLWDGVERLDVRAHVDGSIGQDRLLRARFDLDLPGTLPVSEVGFAAIGRSFGFPNADAAEHLYTLDNPAHNWAGLSTTARIALTGEDGSVARHAIGVAEVVAPAGLDSPVRALLARLAGVGVTATCTRPDGPRYGALDADSNLPDVRIVLGADNAFAAEVLATAGPRYRAALARTGRVFVPATRTRRESWLPDADLRGCRDLPVVIVAGTELGAAVDSLTADLADATIEVIVPDGLSGTAEPAEDYSVALVNHGTPGFVADSDGTFYLSLMRACSGWPSGVWIDGPRRTTPDGSSFSWQHWTHTFRYSLVAGSGDWRRAGFVHTGHEVNHPVRTQEVAAGAGDLPASLSLGSVEPERVVLTALKPRGNPMASGLPGDVDLADGVTLRLYESTGAPATATVRLHGGLTGATATNLLEHASGADFVRVQGSGGRAFGEVTVEIGPADVVTLAAQPAVVRPGAGVLPVPPATEPAQPVFTRYWLHNKGPAPLGYLPVSVHIQPPALQLATVDDEASIRLTVACANQPATGVVTLDIPAALTVEAPRDLAYDLKPGGYFEFDLTVHPGASGASGVFLLSAGITDPLGQLLEDTATVELGPQAGAELVVATAGPAALTLAPGGAGVLFVHLANQAGSTVRGEAQLISPYGSWGGPDSDLHIGPRTRGFAIEPGAGTELRFAVRASASARPGSQWWALAKVSCHGRVYYTAATRIEIGSPAVAPHP
jgi:hypothetical protein